MTFSGLCLHRVMKFRVCVAAHRRARGDGRIEDSFLRRCAKWKKSKRKKNELKKCWLVIVCIISKWTRFIHHLRTCFSSSCSSSLFPFRRAMFAVCLWRSFIWAPAWWLFIADDGHWSIVRQHVCWPRGRGNDMRLPETTWVARRSLRLFWDRVISRDLVSSTEDCWRQLETFIVDFIQLIYKVSSSSARRAFKIT